MSSGTLSSEFFADYSCEKILKIGWGGRVGEMFRQWMLYSIQCILWLAGQPHAGTPARASSVSGTVRTRPSQVFAAASIFNPRRKGPVCMHRGVGRLLRWRSLLDFLIVAWSFIPTPLGIYPSQSVRRVRRTTVQVIAALYVCIVIFHHVKILKQPLRDLLVSWLRCHNEEYYFEDERWSAEPYTYTREWPVQSRQTVLSLLSHGLTGDM